LRETVTVVASAFLPFTVPLFWNVLSRRRDRLVVDSTLLLMFVFLAAVSTSALLAKDEDRALAWLLTYVTEGILVYLIILNVVRTKATLQRIIWVLILSGGFLGGLTVYQEVTRAYDQHFAGLAQRNIEYGMGNDDLAFGKELFRPEHKIHLAERAAGPIGDPNRYAQILIVLLPLAYFHLRGDRRLLTRAVVLALLVLILGGLLLTYSRGGFLALVVIAALMTLLGCIRLPHLAVSIALIVLTLSLAAPGFFLRMDSLRAAGALVGKGGNVEPDGAMRGRATEMLAALNVFRDYPLLGVGPGQFAHLYSVDYMSNPEVAFRHVSKVRRAHSLYFELAAETGVLGFSVFALAVGWTMWRLWQVRRRWLHQDRTWSDVATACWLGIIGYLGTAFFLQLAYQRYFWLLMGISGAVIHVMESQSMSAVSSPEPTPSVPARHPTMVPEQEWPMNCKRDIA
jgi:O-antigen ligase